MSERSRVDDLEDFARYVARAVCNEHKVDGGFEGNAETYAEMFCRKLWRLGYVTRTDDGFWAYNRRNDG